MMFALVAILCAAGGSPLKIARRGNGTELYKCVASQAGSDSVPYQPKCVASQAGSSGVPLISCEKACLPATYKCINNQCVLYTGVHAEGPVPSGVDLSTCQNLCYASQIWSFPTGGAVYSSPAVSSDGKVVYVGSGDNNLYAVDAVNGSKIWSFLTGNLVQSSPAVSSDGKVVYVGSDDTNLYAVDAVNGSKIWSFQTGGDVESSPAVSSDGKVVYVGSDYTNLYAVEA